MYVKKPLDELCEKLEIPKFKPDTEYGIHCNEKTNNCITFVAFFNTNGDGPIIPPLHDTTDTKIQKFFNEF